MPPSSVSSCGQQQIFSFRNNAANVVVQNNIWQISILQTLGSSPIVTSVQVNSQGQPITGTVLLLFINANQGTSGPYVFQMNSDGSLIFQNIPSTPMSLIQIQFPHGTKTSNYIVNIGVCLQTNSPTIASILLILSFPIIHSECLDNQQVSQQWIAPAPAPVQNNNANNNQIVSNQYQYPGAGSMLFFKYSFIDEGIYIVRSAYRLTFI